jgi:hypothetical protein
MRLWRSSPLLVPQSRISVTRIRFERSRMQQLVALLSSLDTLDSLPMHRLGHLLKSLLFGLGSPSTLDVLNPFLFFTLAVVNIVGLVQRTSLFSAFSRFISSSTALAASVALRCS